MKKMLLVIDMQNDFITGSLGTPEAVSVVPKVVNLAKEFIENKDSVWFTQDTHYTDTYLNTQEGKNLPVEHCIYNQHGWNICSELNDLMGVIIPKDKSFSVIKEGFGSIDLAECISRKYKKGEITEVCLVGLCTDICVIANAVLIKSFCPEIKVKVDASCCAGVTPESHKNALQAMKVLQIEIVNE